eukprot:jgi/Galph1/3200/GphlegSOOS_G1870.1
MSFISYCFSWHRKRISNGSISNRKRCTICNPTTRISITILSSYPSATSPPPPPTASTTLSEKKATILRKEPIFQLSDDTLEATGIQRIVTIGTLLALAILFLQNLSYNGIADCIAIGMGYVLADLASGVYHWILDNYGDIDTPIIGKQCVAFQGHHKSPWTITWRTFCNLVAPSCIVCLPFAVTCIFLDISPFLKLFLSSFGLFVVLAQLFHQWAHQNKHPAFVSFLQEKGLILSVKEHGRHHTPPFNKKYCIVSGLCNSFLDKYDIFGSLERWLFVSWHLTPNHWKRYK